MPMRLSAIVATTTAVLLLSACGSSMSRGDMQNAARVNTQLGINYAQQGHFSVALEKLERALDQDDSLPETHAAIAYVYQNLGESKKAERHFREALDLSPGDPALKNNFGVFLCSMGRYEEAELLLLAAAKDPTYPTPEAAWTNAGTCIKAHNLDKAEIYLREALKIDPQYREALAQMASISFRKTDYLRARAFLQRYDLQSNATAELLFIAARTERELGDLETARRYERRLKSEFPESVEAASFEVSP